MSHYCRLCLEYDKDFSSVFVENEGETVADLIFLLLAVKIDQQDEFSKVICEECFDVLMKASTLRARSEENQKYLSTYNESFAQHPIKDEIEIDDSIQFVEQTYEAAVPVQERDYGERVIAFDTTPLDCKEQLEDPFDEKEEVKDVNEEPASDAVQDEEEELLVEEKPQRTKAEYQSYEPKSKRQKLEFQCKTCDKTFQHKATLIAHHNTEHNDLKRPHKCNKCKNQFAKRIELNTHLKIHEIDIDASKSFEGGEKIKPRRCAGCSQKFKDFDLLEGHWDDKHNPILNPFSCAYCELRTRTEESIFKHVKTAHHQLSFDQYIVLIREGHKSQKVGKSYISPKLAIFVNPIDAAKNSEYEKRKIKNETIRLEKHQNNKTLMVGDDDDDDDEVVVFAEPSSDPLQGPSSQLTNFRSEIVEID